MNVGIAGSGFGLYGYMPAVLEAGHLPVMPVRYRDKLLSRQELCRLDTSIDWVDTESELLSRSDALIVALNPSAQVALVKSALRHGNIKRYLLEKPIAANPSNAIELLLQLKSQSIRVQAGFTFRYTPWANSLYDAIQKMGEESHLSIIWSFKAHHFAHGLDTWKRYHSEGGGALRFYGIHIVALLSEWGYSHVEGSRLNSACNDQPEQWEATFAGPDLPVCKVWVDANAEERRFHVKASTGKTSEGLKVMLSDPFDELPSVNGLDRRIVASTHAITALLDTPPTPSDWIEHSVLLWAACDHMSSG